LRIESIIFFAAGTFWLAQLPWLCTWFLEGDRDIRIGLIVFDWEKMFLK